VLLEILCLNSKHMVAVSEYYSRTEKVLWKECIPNEAFKENFLFRVDNNTLIEIMANLLGKDVFSMVCMSVRFFALIVSEGCHL
jgi:hypothetical protein